MFPNFELWTSIIRDVSVRAGAPRPVWGAISRSLHLHLALLWSCALGSVVIKLGGFYQIEVREIFCIARPCSSRSMDWEFSSRSAKSQMMHVAQRTNPPRTNALRYRGDGNLATSVATHHSSRFHELHISASPDPGSALDTSRSQGKKIRRIVCRPDELAPGRPSYPFVPAFATVFLRDPEICSQVETRCGECAC